MFAYLHFGVSSARKWNKIKMTSLLGKSEWVSRSIEIHEDVTCIHLCIDCRFANGFTWLIVVVLLHWKQFDKYRKPAWEIRKSVYIRQYICKEALSARKFNFPFKSDWAAPIIRMEPLPASHFNFPFKSDWAISTPILLPASGWSRLQLFCFPTIEFSWQLMKKGTKDLSIIY